jgi:crotonobetainyl-CoA:carnitine CoA-transferase CaiB-like acyl-CoA transferase
MNKLPFEGLRVVEFTHMVMGPACGMILGDLGADVIKIEPPNGENSRNLLGAGAGFFRMFNRNKKSVTADLANPKDLKRVFEILSTADIVVENFRPNALKKFGLDYESLKDQFPRLIYASHKGFLPGPYDHRTALDEVVQMMAGLSFMTGDKSGPRRAGSSVNDIMGGMFGAIGVMAALYQRQETGKGCEVQSSLFENCVLLSGQHMQQFVVTGEKNKPMVDRISPWALYDNFKTKDDEIIFLAAVSDNQWVTLCKEFGLDHYLADPNLKLNNQRVTARPWLIPALQSFFQSFTKAELEARFEKIGLPFAPVVKPHDLFQDPHLLASGGLQDVELPEGGTTPLPLIPLLFNGERLKTRRKLPKVGEHNEDWR